MTHETRLSDQPLDESLISRLLDDIVAAIPAAKERTHEERRAQREFARAIMVALRPRNAIEAMLAVQAIAAHHGLMDCLARAARPGTSDPQAIRLRNGAVALGRRFDAALRMLQKSSAPSKPPARQAPVTATASAMPFAHRPVTVPAQTNVPVILAAPKVPSAKAMLAGSTSQLAINALLAPPQPARAAASIATR